MHQTKRGPSRRYPDAPYRFVKIVGHPLADIRGWVAEHRVVLHDKIGPGEHRCHWCGKAVVWRQGRRPWRAEESLVVDHLDDNGQNNDFANLVASCVGCNGLRGRGLVAL